WSARCCLLQSRHGRPLLLLGGLVLFRGLGLLAELGLSPRIRLHPRHVLRDAQVFPGVWHGSSIPPPARQAGFGPGPLARPEVLPFERGSHIGAPVPCFPRKGLASGDGRRVHWASTGLAGPDAERSPARRSDRWQPRIGSAGAHGSARVRPSSRLSPRSASSPPPSGPEQPTRSRSR